MRAVVDPGPACLDELACRDHRRMTKDGDQVPLAPGLHSQNAKAILRVVEGHAVDEPGQDLGWRARPGCLRHQGMMETKIPLDQAREEGHAALATGKRPRRRGCSLARRNRRCPWSAELR